ncbi:unnamed protein product [Adineta steineri]|uniref:SRCR domain-containing protein n=1 Tax=Adineta steineri TaxID=433720 RepID=A0A814H242_9BILA|nr:unnamed protein product [Adineta steineri]
MMSHSILLLSITVLLCVTNTHGNQRDSGLGRMLKSIDKTCTNIHSLLTYQRKIVNITITKEAPVRIKVDMELTTPQSPTSKQYFSVEGMICHNGFDRNAAQAACRSQKKKLQMFSTNYEWEASSTDLHDKCYFEYNSDPFVVPCDFILDNFSCTSDATSLNDCTYTPLFQHQCTNDMHVGIGCAGTYEPPTTTTTQSTSTKASVVTPTPDEQTVTGVLNRHNWTDIGAAIDVTGSMSECYAQIDQWMALSNTNKLVQYFAFFNDGDTTEDEDKVIGSTGGIYGVHTSEGIAKVLATLNTAKTNGHGGDGPENDIEAILYAIANCSTCENIIHIADNGVTPRDLILLNRVTKPIKVIVCKLSAGTPINPKLLDVAHKTGGSLHTLDSDVESLGSLKVGDTLRIGSGVYRLDATGFILYIANLSKGIEIDTLPTIDGVIETCIDKAAELILYSDAILFTSGAGWILSNGSDINKDISTEVWPPLLKYPELDFTRMNNAQWFRKAEGNSGKHNTANFSYAFWAYRYNTYNSIISHFGYQIVKQWSEMNHIKYSFSFTVDTKDSLKFNIDPKTDCVIGRLPHCPYCKQLARPNVLMNDDLDFF